jgi:hypothetical protein
MGAQRIGATLRAAASDVACVAPIHATKYMGFKIRAWVIRQEGHRSSIDFVVIHLTLQVLSPKLFSRAVIAHEQG